MGGEVVVVAVCEELVVEVVLVGAVVEGVFCAVDVVVTVVEVLGAVDVVDVIGVVSGQSLDDVNAVPGSVGVTLHDISLNVAPASRHETTVLML